MVGSGDQEPATFLNVENLWCAKTITAGEERGHAARTKAGTPRTGTGNLLERGEMVIMLGVMINTAYLLYVKLRKA